MRLAFWIRRRTALLGLVIVPTACAWIWVSGSQQDALADALVAENNQKVSDLVVHEWGTFLGMSGADGTALEGMYHEEHALPGFVHGRSRDQLRLPQMFLKGETPVIYFYTKEKQNIVVGVHFPRGIWTQWYPQAADVFPNLMSQAERSGNQRNGRITWQAEVIPRSAMPHSISKVRGAVPELVNMLPDTSSDALWNHAREVDAAFVKTADHTRNPPSAEYERFLFYRGLGDARLPLHVEEQGNGTLTLDQEKSLGDGVSDVFVLRVEGGRGAFSYRPALRPGERADGVIPSMDQAQPLADFTKSISDALATRLAASGLFAKEARAMVNTWANSYFQTEGVRVLFVLPQSWTDAFIPLNISPQPKKVVRVMVGRLEMLSASRERAAEAAIRSLASRDPDQSGPAFRFLHEQGRYIEPIVRRVAKTTANEQVRAMCGRLLLTGFVTDLRAAVHNAADGKPLNADPLLLRAHLARLLREVGQDSDARSEANAVLTALIKPPLAPNQNLEYSASATEIKAAAIEALGDDRGAAEVYARRVEQLTQALNPELSEANVAWLKDWWVGRAYAQCVKRSGQAASIEAALREKLAKTSAGGTAGLADERAARILLGFLLEIKDKESLARSEWQSLLTNPAQKAAAASPDSKLLVRQGPRC